MKACKKLLLAIKLDGASFSSQECRQIFVNKIFLLDSQTGGGERRD